MVLEPPLARRSKKGNIRRCRRGVRQVKLDRSGRSWRGSTAGLVIWGREQLGASCRACPRFREFFFCCPPLRLVFAEMSLLVPYSQK